jgi:putative ABC transport system substrate-binding protein
MRRRDVIALFAAFGGAAVLRPLAAHAQQGGRMRRVGVLMFLGMDDPVGQADKAIFQQALRELGWTEGRNLIIDYRWAAGDVERRRKYAAE